MSRDIDAGNITDASAAVVRPVHFVRLDFGSGIVSVNTSPYDLDFSPDLASPAETSSGLGQIFAIGAVEETADLTATALTLTLAGIPSTLISVALGENYQGRDARLYYGFLDSDHQLTRSPDLYFRGLMDTMDIERGAENATVTVTVQSRLILWERAPNRRYTNEQQQKDYPGDLGFEFVSQTVEKELPWGSGR